MAGPPGGFAMLLLGERTAAPTPIPFGSIAFDPLTAIFVDLVSLSLPWGYHNWTLNCPASAPVA